MGSSDLGRRLKKARLDAGLTQAEVASRLGISYQAISNYERGTNRVDTDTLSRLCAIYNINVGSLLRTPAWTDEMRREYDGSTSPEYRSHLIEAWGCPDFLIEQENDRREPDSPALSLSTDEQKLLDIYRRVTLQGQEYIMLQAKFAEEHYPISPSRDTKLG